MCFVQVHNPSLMLTLERAVLQSLGTPHAQEEKGVWKTVQSMSNQLIATMEEMLESSVVV